MNNQRRAILINPLKIQTSSKVNQPSLIFRPNVPKESVSTPNSNEKDKILMEIIDSNQLNTS